MENQVRPNIWGWKEKQKIRSDQTSGAGKKTENQGQPDIWGWEKKEKGTDRTSGAGKKT
jgi:hypothetical protein